MRQFTFVASGIVLLFVALFWWHSWSGLSSSLAGQLQQHLPQKLKNALYYSDKDGPISQLVMRRLNQDLAGLHSLGGLGLFEQCYAELDNLYQSQPLTSFWPQGFSIQWQVDDKLYFSHFTLHCQTQWPVMLVPLSLSLLLISALYCLPVPLGGCARLIQARLQAQGIQAKAAARLALALSRASKLQQQLFELLLSQHRDCPDALLEWLQQPAVGQLNELQLQWFSLAVQRFDCTKQQALAVALADDGVSFQPQLGQLQIRGLTISLAKTPYLYYLWYAWLRCNDDGWQLNPPVNRADHQGAQQLIALMQQFGGHPKAINDLTESGLRAKILDQNRNKLKIELVAMLGEELAQAYLFDTERDLKSGRYRYRLCLSSEQICLPVINL